MALPNSDEVVATNEKPNKITPKVAINELKITPDLIISKALLDFKICAYSAIVIKALKGKYNASIRAPCFDVCMKDITSRKKKYIDITNNKLIQNAPKNP